MQPTGSVQAVPVVLFEVGGNQRHERVIAHQFANLFGDGVAFGFGLIRCRPQFGADHRLPAVEERLLDLDDAQVLTWRPGHLLTTSFQRIRPTGQRPRDVFVIEEVRF